MAKKKKKNITQQHKRQQKKQQRRSSRVQARGPVIQHRSPPPGAADFAPPRRGLVDDVRPLFGDSLGAPSLPDKTMEEVMDAVWDTHDLVDEDEFAEIAVAPIEAFNAYINAAQSVGIDHPDELDGLAEEEREERIEQMLNAALSTLFTENLKAEVIEGLERLRRRWKKERRFADIPRVAAAQLMLETDPNNQITPGIGVVRALITRSVDAGFQLMAAVDTSPLDMTGSSPREIYRQLNTQASEVDTESLLNLPGMEPLLNKQLDAIWQQSESALFVGDLFLDLYTTEEVIAAVKIFNATYDLLDGPLTDENAQEFLDLLIPDMETYLDEIMTDERFEQLCQRLDEVLDDPTYGDSPHVPFLMLLRDELDEEDGYENNVLALVKALCGEVRTFMNKIAAAIAGDEGPGDESADLHAAEDPKH